MRTLVAGIDSSTQSCKIVVRDADTGALVRSGQASHPAGTEVDPETWWDSLLTAAEAAGGLADVSAVAVGGQQHGLVALDRDGAVIRPALLWNDTRSADAAAELTAELGELSGADGAGAWARSTGSVLVASLTVTKLRWLARQEPERAARVAAVALPHDWLTWRLSGVRGLETLTTDRSDASGTGYFDSRTDTYRRDLLARALLRESADDIVLPRVLGPSERAGTGAAEGPAADLVLGPGAGDNAAAALGLSLGEGDVALSLGTSAVVSAVSPGPVADPSGRLNGFADATGRFLPLVVMLNGSRVLDTMGTALGVGHEELSDLALAAPAGASGLTLLPYLDGERVPDLPRATGSLLGITRDNLAPQNLARAAVEGLLCGLADGLDALREHEVPVQSVQLIGGAARSRAVQQLAPTVLGLPIAVPEPREYVADGMTRQAAWVLAESEQPPDWSPNGSSRHFSADAGPTVRHQYADRAHLVAERPE